VDWVAALTARAFKGLSAAFGLRRERLGQAKSLEGQQSALLDTIEALAQGSEREFWPRLIQSLVEGVPGAKAGSIRLREGKQLRFVAERGYGPAIVGIYSEEHEAIRWYGDEVGWRRGEPRIYNAAQLFRVFELDKATLGSRPATSAPTCVFPLCWAMKWWRTST
jgi:hypothetical protein